MDTQRLDRLERLFQAALLHDPADRAAFLAAACADDPELLRERPAPSSVAHAGGQAPEVPPT